MIVISNGFGRFPLRIAAAETAARGLLTAFATGAYPTPGLTRALRAAGLARLAPLARFLARREAIPDRLVRAFWAGEPLYQIGSRARRVKPLARGAADRIHLIARGLYAMAAARLLRRLPRADGRGIYYYRAGFGGRSVARARARGWLCLCHHSIAHPAVLEHLVANRGRLPDDGGRGPIDGNWRHILADIDRADRVVVNSDFVKATFRHQGWSDDRVDVIYFGVDDRFLAAIPERAAAAGPLRLLFAGAFNRRKGGPDLAAALAALDGVDWTLDLCGPVGPDAAAAFDALESDPRVSWHGNLSSPALAARMAAADVFVFPSLAEGSARVVFEALAAGCYVVTTPNAGSIVADGVHGALVPPGDARALAAALAAAAADRARVARIGAANAALIRAEFRQRDYGARLADLYERLLPR